MATLLRASENRFSLSQLSDHDLLAHVQLAAQAERLATAHLIALLMELDVRRLYLGEGYSSLFTYCTQALHLSESAAYTRIEVARAARRYPVILELLEAGDVTLTTVRLLAPHLTADNHREVLDRARHTSKRDVELLVARLNPRPDVPPTIRKLPTPPFCTAPAPATDAQQRAANGGVLASFGPPVGPREKHPAELKPLAPERYKMQFTVNRETYDKLRRAQDLLRHAVPDGDPAIIFERALTLLVAELERTKIGATKRPRAARRTNATSRYIPAAVRRTVWQRDGGRCAFKGAKGRCTETGFLEYHHVVPFAVGGETSARNVELRCKSHNQYEADQYFGPAHAPLLRERRAFYGTNLELVPEQVGGACHDALDRSVNAETFYRMPLSCDTLSPDRCNDATTS